MNLTIKRTDFLSTGIFGELDNQDETLFLYSLEHAYPIQEDTNSVSTVYKPKIPAGSYVCVRGNHQLADMSRPFETFEITNVPGHTGCLFHPGNTEYDSSGCILLGLSRVENKEILQSKDAFEMFMQAQEGVNSFNLIII